MRKSLEADIVHISAAEEDKKTVNAQHHQTNFKLAKKKLNNKIKQERREWVSLLITFIPRKCGMWNWGSGPPATRIEFVLWRKKKKQSVGVLMTLYVYSIESVRRSASCSVRSLFASFTGNFWNAFQVRGGFDGFDHSWCKFFYILPSIFFCIGKWWRCEIILMETRWFQGHLI